MTEPTGTRDPARRAPIDQEPVALIRGDKHPEGKGFGRFFGRMAGLVSLGIVLFLVGIAVIVIMVMTYGAR